MATSQREIESQLAKLSAEAFQCFCKDFSSIYGVETTYEKQPPRTETVKKLKRYFKDVAAICSVKADGILNNQIIQLIFGKEGLFTLGGVMIVLPRQRILENRKSGTAKKALEISDTIKQAGDMMANAWNKAYRKESPGPNYFMQKNVFVGNLPDRATAETGLADNQELVFIPYKIKIASYSPFKCGFIFPKGNLSKPAGPEPKIEIETAKRGKTEAERTAEEKGRVEAERKAKLEAIEKARAEMRAKIEAERAVHSDTKAKEIAEKKAKIEVVKKATDEARAKARLEAELKAKAEAEEKARIEAERKARIEAEVKAKIDAEIRAKAEAEERTRAEAEEKAKAEAERRAQLEAIAMARAEAKAKAEAEGKAKAEAKAKETADTKTRKEAERKAKYEAKAKIKSEKKAKAELEARARAEAKARAKAIAEEKAKVEEWLKAKAEMEARAKEIAKEKARVERRVKAEVKAKETAKRKAKIEAEKKARIEAIAKAKAKAKVKIEAERRAKSEAKAKAKLERRARIKAEKRAKAEARERARLEAELQVKAEAEEKAKIEAEEKAKAEAKIRSRLEAEAKMRAKAGEKARAETERKTRMEAIAKAEEEARAKAEAERTARAAARAQEKARRIAEKKARTKAREKGRADVPAKAEAYIMSRYAEEKAKLEAEEKTADETEVQETTDVAISQRGEIEAVRESKIISIKAFMPEYKNLKKYWPFRLYNKVRGTMTKRERQSVSETIEEMILSPGAAGKELSMPADEDIFAAPLPSQDSEPMVSLCAEDIMQRNVVWGRGDYSIQQALEKMQEHNTNYMLVGENKLVAGIVSKSDLTGNISPYLRPEFARWRRPLDDATLHIKIKWVMSRPVQVIRLDTPLVVIMENMRRFGRRALPVADGHGNIEGLVTVFDVFKSLISNGPDNLSSARIPAETAAVV